jgi:hypothetical protein
MAIKVGGGGEEVENDDQVESARDVTARALADLAGDDGGGGGEGIPEAGLEKGSASGDAEQQAAARARDEAGRFSKQQQKLRDDGKSAARVKAPPARVPAAGTAGAAPGQVIPPGAASAAPVAGQEAAPKWLKPAIREQWGGLPREVRDEFLRLNGDAARARQEASTAGTQAQGYQEFQKTIQPYEAQIRSQGVEPTKYVGDLLGTVHQLTYGPAHVKADTLAQVVMQFAPDLLRPDMRDANGNPSCPLDRALAARFTGRGAQPGAGPGPGPQGQPQFRDPRLDQLLARAEQQKQQSAQKLETDSAERAQAFGAEHDYFDDVRTELADILEVWAARGKTEVSDEELERAYDLACRTNPDVAPVYEQRKAVQAAAATRQNTQRRRAAASSIRSSPGTAAATADRPMTAREITEKAARDLQGGHV